MTLKKILTFLEEKCHYRRLSNSIHVDESSFDLQFDATLIGSDSNEIIVIEKHDSNEVPTKLYGKLYIFETFLSRIQEHFTITLLLIVHKYNHRMIKSIESSFRVIIVSSDVPLEKSLNMLLPLTLPDAEKQEKSFEDEMRKMLRNKYKDRKVQKLLKASKISSLEVRDTIREIIERDVDLAAQNKND